jgi:Ca-activated chloride channel homolog
VKGYLIILCLLWIGISGNTQDSSTANVIIQQGNVWYKQKEYVKAERAFRDALDKDKGNTTATYNLANALYMQSKPDEAIKVLEELVMNANDAELKGKAYYNKGAILSAAKKLEESIEAYKNALRNNPNDKEARENLQKALLELKKKTPPPKQNKKQEKQQQQQQKMSPKEAEQRLKLLEQKEKEIQEKLNKEKSKNGGSQPKDW